jgi:exonuclease VII small subunit
MPLSRILFCLPLLAIPAVVCVPVMADEPAGEATKAAESTPDQITELIKQLDDANFNTRQTATRKLAQAGEQAIPALEKAAKGDSREVITRSIDVLKKLMEGGAEASAKAALERLAESDKPSTSQRAKNALKPAEGEQPGGLQPFGQIFPGGGNIQGNIQIRVVGGPGARKVSIKNNNGNKEIEAEEGGKKIKINEEAGGKIKVEITQKNDQGKEETKKYEAKNAAELKKNHPEAHKEYEKYSKQGAGNIIVGGGGIQIMPGGRIQIQPGGMPRAIPVPIQPAMPKDQAKKFEDAIKRMEKIAKEMENQGNEDRIKRLDEQIKRLQEMRKQLEDQVKNLEDKKEEAEKE